MTEVVDVLISVCVFTAGFPLHLEASFCAQLRVSMVTRQLIRAALCLSEVTAASRWAHDAVRIQTGPGLKEALVHIRTRMQTSSDTYVLTLHPVWWPQKSCYFLSRCTFCSVMRELTGYNHHHHVNRHNHFHLFGLV